MGEQEIRGIHPPIVIVDEMETLWTEVPLTREFGERIGTARVRHTDEGMEIEATVDEEHAHLLRNDPSPQFSLAGDGTGVQYVSGSSLFEQEVGELQKLINVYDGITNRRPLKQDKGKPKRRAASKRARKARKNRG